ncbi:MAG: glycosyltransferase family 9 protein, partial [Desulfomonilaceae bacterium]
MGNITKWGHDADGLVGKSILIVRPDNLGDVVLFSGALRAIREKWAASRITICVKRFVTDYL